MKPKSVPPPASDTPPIEAPPVSRRAFLGRGLAVAAAGAIAPAIAAAGDVDPLNRVKRANRALRIRQVCALREQKLPPALHPNNGDEVLYADRIGNFSKGLPSNSFGEVTASAYNALLHAFSTGEPSDFEAIPHGAASPESRKKFVNPQSALAFELEGVDSHALSIPPAPAFASAELAGEIVENYWMALTRDVAFTDYATNPVTQAAAADLSLLSDFRGPKTGGLVTTQTLFRDNVLGGITGPYLSQFLLLPVPFGANYIDQRMRTALPGVDFMTSYAEWLNIQRGELPSASSQYDPTRRFIRNGRDLAQWVHVDVLFQAYFHAMLILLTPPDAGDANSGGIGAPFDSANPYAGSLNQTGFGTFGGPHIAALMCEVATRALRAAWYQKWSVHRRLRPEAFAGRVHNYLVNGRVYPLALGDLQNSAVLPRIFARDGGYLLPMAFPEGCPLHPSYGAGHATVAGACVTILKAWFNENFSIPQPVVPSADGLSLMPYNGAPLTIGGELNKLASNIATGRNIAGVHWRSDAAESLKLGEAVAISVLRDQRLTYNEDFAGFTLTKFDGTQVTV